MLKCTLLEKLKYKQVNGIHIGIYCRFYNFLLLNLNLKCTKVLGKLLIYLAIIYLGLLMKWLHFLGRETYRLS